MYTVVIRTLGTAGEKYQRELDSLMLQTMPPDEILVYIAEGYPIPRETCGRERYIYVKKGMVAQRALPYDEVKTEWILFLDDDVYLPPTAVETLFTELKRNSGDVISPCVFHNNRVSWMTKVVRTITGKEMPRLWGRRWGYKVMDTCGFSYNNNPVNAVYESDTNAGPCFLCKKKDFLSIKFEDELWLDKAPYAIPEDQVMFYKMSRMGMKILTSFDSGIEHMDAGSTLDISEDKDLQIIYSEYRNKIYFWHRFIYPSKRAFIEKFKARIALLYVIILHGIKYKITNKKKYKVFRDGVRAGISMCKLDRS